MMYSFVAGALLQQPLRFFIFLLFRKAPCSGCFFVDSLKWKIPIRENPYQGKSLSGKIQFISNTVYLLI